MNDELRFEADCEGVRSLLPQYLAGDLEEEERSRVGNHVASCAGCAACEDAERELNRVLRQAFSPDQPALGLQQRIREKISAAGAPRRWPMPVAVAASLVLALGLVVGGSSGYNVYAAHRFCQDAADDHEEEVVQGAPRRWALGGADLQRLQSRFGGGMPLPERIGEYQFQRARICELAGKDFIHAVYAASNREFSVFLGPRLPQNESEIPRLKMVRTERVGATAVAEYHAGPVVLLVAGNHSLGSVLDVFDEWTAGR
ncbi:MAG: zf-HC2 domain-containing protein [Acidobacteria bacterium]|nr:zf-HC2 domain-containing protein [Acidobacteriota bacterium]